MRKLLYSLAIALTFISCQSLNLPDGTPRCIRDEIGQLSKAGKQNPPAEVWKWQVGDKTYYYFNAPCCDQYSRLVDESCNFVCAPDGGFTGKGDGKCPDLSNAAKTLVWKDTRD